MSKIYVNMRKKTSKKGNEYLGGYDKRNETGYFINCLLYTSPSPRDLSTSRMPSSA